MQGIEETYSEYTEHFRQKGESELWYNIYESIQSAFITLQARLWEGITEGQIIEYSQDSGQTVHRCYRLRPDREGLGIFSLGNPEYILQAVGGQKTINIGMGFMKSLGEQVNFQLVQLKWPWGSHVGRDDQQVARYAQK